MSGDPSLSGALGYFLWFLGELAFKWVPGIAVSVATNTEISAPPITQPVSAPQVAQFLQTSSAPGVYDQLFSAWKGLIGISTFVSLMFAALLVYSFIRITQHRRHYFRHLEAMQRSVAVADIPQTHLRWHRIEEQLASDDPQSWRLAILEADIMLGELLDLQGYRGETMADKMRQVDRAQFNTIDLAWEAHRVRNKVVHEGEAMQMNAREAQRVVGLYEQVFKEFNFIG